HGRNRSAASTGTPAWTGRGEVDVEAAKHPRQGEPESHRLRYRVAFAVTATVMLAIVVTLPFSVAGIVDDLLGPSTGKVIAITDTPHAAAAPTHSRVHVAFVALDEIDLMATLRISRHYVCHAGALVLGIWGIRAIIVPGDVAYLTAVDLALSTVIIFLLGAMT